jgi:hypothetical protein
MGNPLRWVLYRSVGYLRGRGLAFGAASEVLPKSAGSGVYTLRVDALPQLGVAQDLSVFAPQAFDWVWAGPRLTTMPDSAATLREVVSKLRIGGHLVVQLPLEVAEPATPISPEAATGLVGQLGNWLQKASYIRDGQLLQIYKLQRGAPQVQQLAPPAAKRACIVRYGAIGDMIILSPLVRQLAEDGYQVTLNITPYGAAVWEHNPFVANLVLQERDAIPNSELGPYWAEWQSDYDRYINLSESLEGSLLKVERRRDFYTTQRWRHEVCNVNYYDRTMQLGGYPTHVGRRGELYFSSGEERQARKFRDRFRDKFLVLWALNGSSHHKLYGLLEPVLNDWLEAHPDAVVVTIGDYTAKLLEFEHPQVVPKAGEWPLRHSLCMTKYADLVVGPETGVLNAAGCFATPKITLLSHSSHENLCKHWENDYCLAPDPAIAPCYPCHQLHFERSSCPAAEIVDDATGEVIVSGPCCAMGAISGNRVIERLNAVYDRWAASHS